MATIYNVIKWADNTAELDKHLQQGLGTTEKVTKALDKMSRSLVGEKLVKDAKLMADALGGVEGASLLTEKAQIRVNKVMTEAIAIYQSLGKDPPQIFRDLAAATEQQADALEGLQKRLNGYASGAKSIGMGMTAAVTAPIVAGFGFAAKAAIDFESSFAGVRKTVDASDAELQDLAKGFRDLSKEIPTSVNELNRIGESAGQLGIKTPNILGFSKVMAELGVTTNLSSDQAATSLARLANITQMPQDQFDRLGSTVVGLGNNFATTESEIVDMGLRIAGAGQIAGLTEPQILSIGAAMASVGMEAEAGGTAVQKVLNGMTAAVAAGGPQLEEFARTAGLSASAFATAYKQDAGEAFALFVEGLGRQGDQAFATLDNLGLGNERVIRAFLSLGNAGDLLRDALRRGSTEWERNTALVDEAGKRFGTTESKLTTLWNKASDVAITVGTAMAPAIEAAIGVGERAIPVIDMLAQGFAALPPTAQTVVLGFFALTAAAGPLVYISGQMASVASILIGLWRNKAVAGRALSSTYDAMTTNVGALSTSTRLLGTATTVTAAAFAGWTLGRIIAETFDLDTKIGNLAARILGLGDVAAETAGAKQDSINLAIQRGAAATVTYTEAIKFNDEWVRKRTGALRASATVHQQTATTLSFATAGFDTLTAKLKTAEGEIQRLSAAQRADLSKALQAGVFDMKELATATGLSEDALKIFQRQVKDTATATAKDTRDMAKSFEQGYAAVRKFAAASMFGGDYDRRMKDTLSQAPRLWLEAGVPDKSALAAGWNSSIQYALRTTAQKVQQNPYVGDVRGPNLVPGIDAASLRVLGEGSAITIATPLLRGLGDTLRTGMPDVILRAITGGGSVPQAAASLVGTQLASNIAANAGKTLTSTLGKTLGGAITSVIPGLGALAGPLLGKLFALGGPSQRELEGRDVFAQIAKSAGGVDRLLADVGEAYRGTGRSALQAQADVKQMMDATRVGGDAVKQVWDQVNAVLAEHGERQRAVNGGIADLQAAYAAAGSVMPEALRETVRTLSTMTGLTHEQRTALEQLAAGGVPNFKLLQQEAEGLGISLEQLGPRFQQAHITEEGVKIGGVLARLQDAGADMGGVFEGASGKVIALVQDARRYGAALPESLRPIATHLFEQGRLIDANGGKLADFAALSFEETPLDASSQAIVTAIDKLRELFEGMPGVAERMASGVATAIDRIPSNKVVRIDFQSAGDTGGDSTLYASRGVIVGPWLRPQYFTEGGFPWVPKGFDTVPAMLRKHEMVLTPEHQRVVGALLRQAPGHDGGARTTVAADFGEMKRELAATRKAIDRLDQTQRRQGAEFAEVMLEGLRNTRLRIAS